MGKPFVTVTSEHDPSGNTKTMWLNWIDGQQYEICWVTDIRQAPAIRAGGLGIRFTCKIRGKEVYLFEDEGRWFVEGWK